MKDRAESRFAVPYHKHLPNTASIHVPTLPLAAMSSCISHKGVPMLFGRKQEDSVFALPTPITDY